MPSTKLSTMTSLTLLYYVTKLFTVTSLTFLHYVTIHVLLICKKLQSRNLAKSRETSRNLAKKQKYPSRKKSAFSRLFRDRRFATFRKNNSTSRKKYVMRALHKYRREKIKNYAKFLILREIGHKISQRFVT